MDSTVKLYFGLIGINKIYLKIKLGCFFYIFNMAITKFEIPNVACITFLLVPELDKQGICCVVMH